MRGLSRARTAVWLVGLLAAVGAAVLLVAPGSLLRRPALRAAVSALAGVDSRQFALLLATAVGLLGLVLALIRGVGRPVEEGLERLRERPPEAVTESEAPRHGAAFDRRVAGAVEGVRRQRASVRGRLRSTAVRTYARATGSDESAARRAVAAGTWTDDPTAAAFLAAPDGPAPSLVSRLRLWLDPVAERRRRIEATVDAVESLVEDDRGAGDRGWSR